MSAGVSRARTSATNTSSVSAEDGHFEIMPGATSPGGFCCLFKGYFLSLWRVYRTEKRKSLRFPNSRASSRIWRDESGRRTLRGAVAAYALPHFPAVHWHIFVNLEAQAHAPLADLEHRDFEQALEAVGTSDDDGFLAFSRQDQH